MDDHSMSYSLGQQKIRVRMAPSPTGRLHIGTARTALFNYLFAKKHGGEFILRIEDTDKERSSKEFEDGILSYLRWLGISWDEGPVMEHETWNMKHEEPPPDVSSFKFQVSKYVGTHAPYRQSERTEIYKPYIEQLLAEGKAFYCFMTEAELDAERKNAEAAGAAFLIRSPYRDLPLVEAKKKVTVGAEYVIRFKIPATAKTVAFDDLIRGYTVIPGNVIEDFAIAKNPETPLYNFTVVIDDHLMEISHVIRGEDHISNTPKQILLYAALGWEPPKFAHLPLILGPDRSKLSKRHGATSVVDFEAQGYLPEALVNFMAFLGWNPGDAREIFTLADLEKEFSLERVQKSGAIFNQEKLDWMNAQHIKRLPEEELLKRVKPFLATADRGVKMEEWKLLKVVQLAKDRMKKLSEIYELSEFFFHESIPDREMLRWKQMSDREVVGSLERTKKLLESISEQDFTADAADTALKEYAKGVKDKGLVFWPLRVALTGRKASPPPAPIMGILGKIETIGRIKRAITFVEKVA